MQPHSLIIFGIKYVYLFKVFAFAILYLANLRYIGIFRYGKCTGRHWNNIINSCHYYELISMSCTYT